MLHANNQFIKRKAANDRVKSKPASSKRSSQMYSSIKFVPGDVSQIIKESIETWTDLPTSEHWRTPHYSLQMLLCLRH